MTILKAHHSSDRETLERLFSRNIANSQKVISGAFEVVLEDLVSQLEDAQAGLPALPERTMRIAMAMRDGFAGLPPNGFEFCLWLWDAAPLHAVRIPQANHIGTAQGFRYGIVHLRSIASQVLRLYAAEQPQLIESIEEMLDSSIGWVDARNHVRYALLEHYIAHYATSYRHLLDLTRAANPWRCFVPIGVATRMLAGHRPEANAVLPLVESAFDRVGEDVIFEGLRYLLRIGGMYGDAQVLLAFLDGFRDHPHERVRALICEFISNPRLRWGTGTETEVREILTVWKRDAVVDVACLDRALLRVAGG